MALSRSFAFGLAACVALMACSKAPPEPTENQRVNKPKPPPDKWEQTDLVMGKGKEAKEGMKVSVLYRGTLKNGTEFDKKLTRDDPFEFVLGEGQVIKGWDKGVLGMKVGGKRKLKIPHELAYGERGSPPKIPPKATLLFEIELLDVKPKE